MTGAPKGSPKVVLCGFMVFFMEKPEIEPATPGLQGIPRGLLVGFFFFLFFFFFFFSFSFLFSFFSFLLLFLFPSSLFFLSLSSLFFFFLNYFFVAFPWVETSTGPGGFMICVFII